MLLNVNPAGGGKLNFDKCIATPMFMPRLSKVISWKFYENLYSCVFQLLRFLSYSLDLLIFLYQIARILGPRGLMPNPKVSFFSYFPVCHGRYVDSATLIVYSFIQLGSVTSDVSGAVEEAKSGRIDFKIDKTAIVHAGLGKVCYLRT